VAEVVEFGMVPNYNSQRSACHSRSRPPLLTDAILEVWPSVGEREWLVRTVSAVRAEYEQYETSEPHLTELDLIRSLPATHRRGPPLSCPPPRTAP
jgi:neutral trehalase